MITRRAPGGTLATLPSAPGLLVPTRPATKHP